MEFENVASYLPESVKEIVDIIGLAETEKLVKSFGGVTFQFSQSAKYFSKLVEVLGQDCAEKLLRYMGSGQVYVPRCESALRLLRNQRLYADFCHLTDVEKLSGRMAILQLCPKYQVSDRTAWEAVRYFQQSRKWQPSLLF